MLSKREILKRDKQQSAIHESGHAIVAASFGIFGSPTIWRNGTTVSLEERSWVGDFRWWPGNESKAQKAAIGVAGLVAEELQSVENILGPDPAADILYGMWDGWYELSATDRAYVPSTRARLAAAVHKAVDVITHPGWAVIHDKVTKRLIRVGVVTDGELFELVERAGLFVAWRKTR